MTKKPGRSHRKTFPATKCLTGDAMSKRRASVYTKYNRARRRNPPKVGRTGYTPLPPEAQPLVNWNRVMAPSESLDGLVEGTAVTAKVANTIKYGFIVEFAGLRAFLPYKEIDENIGGCDVSAFVGRTLPVQINELGYPKGRIVVTHLPCRKRAAEELWRTLDVGQTVKGWVKALKDFGAFVDIGGVDGLLHRASLGNKKLRVGQDIYVTVTRVDRQNRRLSLTLP